MKSEIKKEKKFQKGFTLVEVILVVAIITIISAIAVPQVGKYLNKANRSKIIGAIAELTIHQHLGASITGEIYQIAYRTYSMNREI